LHIVYIASVLPAASHEIKFIENAFMVIVSDYLVLSLRSHFACGKVTVHSWSVPTVCQLNELSGLRKGDEQFEHPAYVLKEVAFLTFLKL